MPDRYGTGPGPDGAIGAYAGVPVAAAGAAGPTTYVAETFTATTTGDLSTNNLSTDELGGGWLGNNTDFSYQGDSTGVNCGATGNAVALVQTNGREDVRITVEMVLGRGSFNGNWNGLYVRSADGATGSSAGLGLQFLGSGTDPNLLVKDGTYGGGSTLHTFDLSVLMTVPPDDGDTIIMIFDCSGNNLTLVSIEVNGGGAETINSTYTLTGGAATAHGSGSGADYYGIAHNQAGSGARFRSFTVTSIP